MKEWQADWRIAARSTKGRCEKANRWATAAANISTQMRRSWVQLSADGGRPGGDGSTKMPNWINMSIAHDWLNDQSEQPKEVNEWIMIQARDAGTTVVQNGTYKKDKKITALMQRNLLNGRIGLNSRL
jgi:hypothetical protein